MFISSLQIGGGTTTINGKVYRGSKIQIKDDGRVVVDGVAQDGAPMVGPIHIVVEGNAESVENTDGSVEVKGSCGSVSTTNGRINCGDVGGSVSTVNGAVTCKSVAGSVSTVNGRITRGDA